MHLRHRHRVGYSLIETLLAASILAIVFVPALATMKRGLEVSRDTETAEMLTTLCVSKMEQHLGMVSVDFTSKSSSGDFASSGHSEIRYLVTQSDAVADGGLVDRLMVITATVWADADGDDTKDNDELEVTLMTKVAAIAVYQTQFGGG